MESLAVKYRPKKFEDVCSQESIIRILSQMIETGKHKNTFLFSGASGCGKTTCARIFAMELNNHCGSPIEIDAASYSGVDNVREIVKSANERSIDSIYKVYIVDEAHALSNAAWQAFLKCIEEPPQYTIFIFCTTDPQKIPRTILNRVMRFNFNCIPSNIIKERLEYICKQEGFTNYYDSCDYISRICNGGMRDAISLLEKCAGYNSDITIQNVLNCLGSFSYDTFFNLINGLIDGDARGVLKTVNDFYNSGNDLKLFVDQFLSFSLDVMKYSIFNEFELTKIPSTMEDKLKFTIGIDNAKQYFEYLIDKLLQLKNMLKNDVEPKSTIEVMMLSICRCQ